MILLVAIVLTVVSGQVVELTKTTFDKQTTAAGTTFVNFYSSRCEHCPQSNLNFQRASSLLARLHPNLPVQFAQIDLSECIDIARKYNITAFPKMRLITRNNSILPYEGTKSAVSFYNFALRSQALFSTPIQEDQLEPVLALRSHLVFTYFRNPRLSPPQYAALMGKGTIGDRFPELLFLHSNSTSIDFADRDLHVRFFRVKDNITLDYDYKSSIADFLIRCSKEHVLDFGEKAATEIFYEGKPGMLLFVRNHQQDIEKQFRRAADLLNERFIFTVCNQDEDQVVCREIGQYLGSNNNNNNNTAEVFLIQAIGLQKFRLQDITESSLIQFASDFEEYRLLPYWKSEPEPPEPQLQPIKKVVATSYERLVLQNQKAIVLNVYSQKCEHSVKFQKLFRAVAKSFAGSELVVFMELDILRNDIPTLRVSQHPSLLFIRGTAAPILFTAEKTETLVAQFVHENLMNFQE